jgi:dihydrofolate synthase/folylpolyglutamate synthase
MIRISTYREAEAYLLDTIDEVTSPRTSYKLDRMRALLRNLGDPHRSYPTIHIGGTSGKSSTSTMIAGALRASGKRTGLHTKPHLHSMTERACINGLPIQPQRFAELLDDAMPAIERTTVECGRPTYYETLLALAFAHFSQERVDVAVIEVGLGGRLDGTNVIDPVVTAITSVGFDHTEILGTTIEAIAFEKAGIAKRGVPLVLGNVAGAARAVIERCAAEAGAPIVYAHDVVQPGDLPPIPVLGIFQRRNATIAIAVLAQLDDALRPSRDAIVRGFAELAIPGRMELIPTKPPVVFDIAHNGEKAESLVASLRESFAGRRVHYVVAIGETKNARRILEILAALPSTFTFTSYVAAGRRAIAPSRLSSIAESFGGWGRAIADPVDALTVARRLAASDDVVVVTGSTFVVAELREWYVLSAV